MHTHEVGEVVAGRFRLMARLGHGSSGVTFEAEDSVHGAVVALKILSLRGVQDWKQVELFEREARVLSSLRYPSIPKYLDYVQMDGPEPLFLLVQELARGQSLAARVKAGWRPDETELRLVAEGILDTLEYLQGLSPPVFHRDIKPENLIRRDDGQVCVVDFGAVTDAHRVATGRGSTTIGTYGYMAPEQFRGQASASTDLYGLGTTLLYVATGISPADFPVNRLKIDVGALVKMRDPFIAWLSRMVEPAEEDRFSDATTASRELRAPSAPRAAPQPRAAAPERAPTSLRTWALLAFLVLALGGLGVRLALTRWAAPRSAGGAVAVDPTIASIRPVLEIRQAWSAVFAVAFAPDGKSLAVASNDRTTRLFSLPGGTFVKGFPSSGGRGGALLFTPDGKTLVTGGDTVVRVWSALTGESQHELKGHTGPVTSLAFEPRAGTLVSGSLDGTVRLWKLDDGTPLSTITHGGAVIGVTVGLGGAMLATAGQDGVVKLWSLPDGKPGQTLAHGRSVSQVVFAPDGQTLVAACDDAQIHVWHVSTAQRLRTFKGHTDEVWSVALHPDGKTLVTGSKDRTIRIWDLYSGKPGLVFWGDGRGVTALAFSPNGAWLASGGANQSVKLWRGIGQPRPTAEQPKEEGRSSDDDVVKRIGWTPLHVAAWDGDAKQVAQLLGEGVDVNARNMMGRMPLYNAAKAGHLSVVKDLLARGAKADAPDSAGRAPLWVAIQNGHEEVFQLLLARGADVKHRTRMGSSYVLKAAIDGRTEMAKTLIEKGVSAKDGDINSETPLFQAASHGHLAFVELLLAQPGVELNVRNVLGSTPLMAAANRGHTEIVKLLVAKGADLNIKNPKGYTALQHAAGNGHVAAVAVLRAAGAR